MVKMRKRVMVIMGFLVKKEKKEGGEDGRNGLLELGGMEKEMGG